jgi:choline kinase
MKGIIIGAGRGQRLMPLTEDSPKCFAEVRGKRILDWALDAFAAGGLRDVVFIGGYLIDRIRSEYPHMMFKHNRDWENNNILASLFYAEDEMDGGFVCSYADILYRPVIVQALMDSPYDITLVADTNWRERYRARTEHPEDDAEKIRCDGDRIIRVARDVPHDEAHGEYIGVARFTPHGASLLRSHYHDVVARYDGLPFHGARTVQKAYLIHMIQELIDRGVAVHKMDTHGGYWEVDTTQDYEIAQNEWVPSTDRARPA